MRVLALLLLALCLAAVFVMPARAFDGDEAALAEVDSSAEATTELAVDAEADAEADEEAYPLRERAHARARQQRQKFRALRSKRTKKTKKHKKAPGAEAMLRPLINDIKDTVAALSDSVDYLHRKPSCRAASSSGSGCGGARRSGSSSNLCSSRARANKRC